MGRAAGSAALVLLALVWGPNAAADTTPIAATPNLPWTDPAHQTPTEVAAGQIASRIAGKAASIRCEAGIDWTLLVTRSGGNPDTELGFVMSRWTSDGRLYDISEFAELTGSVCLSLKQFAEAATKPTKCSKTTINLVTTYTMQTVRQRKRVTVNGKATVQVTTVTRRIPTTVQQQVVGPPEPCYAGNHQSAVAMPNSYWSDYAQYARSIWVLAHESIHLGGAVGGVLANGRAVGDADAEAHANCWGMQWVRYVAEQLGDTPDDAQAIATYVNDNLYPRYRGTSYWSADCVPGGAMDIRPAGATAWP